MSNHIKLSRVLTWLAVTMLLTAGLVQADPNWRENGSSKAAQEARSGGQCVRETAWMRRNHMDLLQHDRDVTVREGVRVVDGSLSECIACHANKNDDGYAPVNSSDQFCAGCHEYTSVSLTCFQCHSTVPGN